MSTTPESPVLTSERASQVGSTSQPIADYALLADCSTDALVFAQGQRGHELGRDAPRELLRLIEGVSGHVTLAMELMPRPEYGLVHPLFRPTEYGGRTFGGPNQIAVCAGVPVQLEDST